MLKVGLEDPVVRAVSRFVEVGHFGGGHGDGAEVSPDIVRAFGLSGIYCFSVSIHVLKYACCSSGLLVKLCSS